MNVWAALATLFVRGRWRARGRSDGIWRIQLPGAAWHLT